ncbi:MAG TPA: hypothetical protein PLY40_06295 [Bacillota bacterium]|nr:hypothetical protein [Bacillota bacterium]
MARESLMERAKQRILEEAPQQRLACRKAFALAGELGLTTAEVGKLCNELEIKITHCQLGCF